MMRSRSTLGTIALVSFAIAFILVVISFATSSWITSDKGARHNSMGLWSHCFSWLSDPNSAYDRRFLVGCDDEIRGFSVPPYNWRIMTTTQVFFTLAFISVILGAILSLLYFFVCSPAHKWFIQVLTAQAVIILFGASCGTIAILAFITQRDLYVWMPFHNFVYFGWSMYVGIVGVIAMFASGLYFFKELQVRKKAMINMDQRGETSFGETIVDVKS